jgi:hypothetical protein
VFQASGILGEGIRMLSMKNGKIIIYSGLVPCSFVLSSYPIVFNRFDQFIFPSIGITSFS